MADQQQTTITAAALARINETRARYNCRPLTLEEANSQAIVPPAGGTDPLTYGEVASYLRRAFAILNVMAGEGISMGGCEDHADLLREFTERLDLDDWDQAMALLGVPANG